MKTNFIPHWIFGIILLIIPLIAFSGCGDSISANSAGYGTFNFSPEDIRFKLKGTLIHEHSLFTFEYPLSFKIVENQDDILLNMRVTTVSFERPAKGQDSLPKTNLSVSVHEPGVWSDKNAETTINNIITYHNADQDFSVIEKGIKDFGGKEAEFIYYSFYQPEREGFGYAPVPAYNGAVKFACFEYKGYIWRACLTCLQEELPETEVYFQHILDSFRIID